MVKYIMYIFIAKPVCAAGWGDTAACIILSEVLDIDCILFVPPDTRIKLSGRKFSLMPLKFIKHSRKGSAGPRKLYMRLKFSHFIVYATSKNRVAPGKAANEDHHLDGTHDVATGMCEYANRYIGFGHITSHLYEHIELRVRYSNTRHAPN